MIDGNFSAKRIFFSISMLPFFACILKHVFVRVSSSIMENREVKKISTAIDNWLCQSAYHQCATKY